MSVTAPPRWAEAHSHPDRRLAATYSTLAFVFAATALLVWPLVLGVIAVACACVALLKAEPRAHLALVLSVTACFGGVLLATFLFHAAV